MRAIVIHAPATSGSKTGKKNGLAPVQVSLRLATGGICGSDLHY
jgi:threonine dehydrogenase-like Zn-dependent dehydrogenase